MAKKYLVFNGKGTVEVHQDKPKGGGELIGEFTHEDNIDPFSAPKFPVLRAHVWDLLRTMKLDTDRDDQDELAELDMEEVQIIPVYEVPRTAEEAGIQNTGFEPVTEQNRTEKLEGEALDEVPAPGEKKKRGGRKPKEVNQEQEQAVLSLDPAVAELKVGEMQQFTSQEGAVFESSDESVVTIDESGLATAVAAGNATIGVQNADGSQSATAEVSVTEDVE